MTNRKLDHLRICLDQVVERGEPGWAKWRIRAASFPELSLGEVDTSAEFLGRKLRFPFVIASMTGGGGKETAALNKTLARAAEEAGVALGLGSMRAALADPEKMVEFDVRHLCPSVPLLGNVGAWQLRDRKLVSGLRKAVRELGLDGIFVHVNVAHELCQPEGERNFSGALKAVCEFAASCPVPVLVKEVGFGLRTNQVPALLDAGVAGFDAAGAGGTDFTIVEALRCGDEATKSMARALGAAAIPAADALVALRAEVDRAFDRPVEEADDRGQKAAAAQRTARRRGLEPQNRQPPVVIGSGGIRNGADVAVALALGADLASAALPVLRATQHGATAVVAVLNEWREQLRNIMALAGARTVAELRGNAALRSSEGLYRK